VFGLMKTEAKAQQSTSKTRQSTHKGTVGSAKVKEAVTHKIYRDTVSSFAVTAATEEPDRRG
jgi:hypothetical protein